MNNQPICFAAGKSGGHIVPCLTIMNQEYPNQSALFFTTDAKLDAQIISKATIKHHIPLPLASAYSNAFLRTVHKIWGLIKSFGISIKYLYIHRPSHIISTGGICAIPVCFAGWLLRIPFTLYELNSIPGRAVKCLAPFAQHIFVSFPEAQKKLPYPHCSFKPYPLRFQKNSLVPGSQSREKLGLLPEKKTILILGGSQGSLFLNQLIHEWLLHHPHAQQQVQLIHQTGGAHLSSVKKDYASLELHALTFDYQEDMIPYYNAASLIICRAGAGTLFEAAYFKKPLVIIPLETSSTDHQLYNAQSLATQYPDFCTLIRQKRLDQTSHELAQAIMHHVGV